MPPRETATACGLTSIPEARGLTPTDGSELAIRDVPHRYAGYQATFDIYIGALDRSRPVGALFYFDGDKADETLLSYNNPAFITAMTHAASTHNLVFIPVHTPVTYGLEGPEYVWWDIRDKGDYARDLAQRAIRLLGVDTHHLWFAGYSGGAEMVMSELLSHDRQWIQGGGAVVMGGGVAEYGVEPATNAAHTLRLLWTVGDRDGEPTPVAGQWSAQVAARSGFQAYSDAGFRYLSFLTLPEQGHAYDIASVVEMGLERMDPAPITARRP